MYGSKWIRIGAITGGLGVSIGALGAHAREARYSERARAARAVVSRKL